MLRDQGGEGRASFEDELKREKISFHSKKKGGDVGKTKLVVKTEKFFPSP